MGTQKKKAVIVMRKRWKKIASEKAELYKTKKPGRHRAFMMDGLVSTRKFLSRHNIKNNFSDIKNFSKIFYAHFNFICGKGLWNFCFFCGVSMLLFLNACNDQNKKLIFIFLSASL